MARQVVLDTETTGMNRGGICHKGHGIVEIGAIEMINRRTTGRQFHTYLRPDRLIDPGAIRVHGITDEFLRDKPSFKEVATEFCDFIHGSQLIIHNAAFDIGFIDYELHKLGGTSATVAQMCSVIDTLALARQLFPGKRNSLDALCGRYQIDNRQRTLHGALLDAEILAEVYLAMTSGQASMRFVTENDTPVALQQPATVTSQPASGGRMLHILRATEAELQAHQERLVLVQHEKGLCLWLAL